MMSTRFPIFLVLAVLLAVSCKQNAVQSDLIYRNSVFALYKDSVLQGRYSARALSDSEISTDYQSPVNLYHSPDISFKFSINGKDNEMLSGRDHHFTCVVRNGSCETPLITFGSQLNDLKPSKAYLMPNTVLKIRLDMRAVLDQFRTKGYFTDFRGERIYKQDFKGVYVAGSTEPLTWDFVNLVNHPDLQLHDDDGDGIYEVSLTLNKHDNKTAAASSWKKAKGAALYPKYHSDSRLADAIYNMSLEEMERAIEPDSTFRTGKAWAGVWTRDVSYSTILSMAYMQPRVAMISLMRKVNKDKKIIQDTGTGGAWPISTDRMIWAVAAWEIYKATGDQRWLDTVYPIIRNSLEDDRRTVYETETGLVKGESTFLDWREQTYPRWMQPADIYQSLDLGTNAVHFEANIVAAKMANRLHFDKETAGYLQTAAVIKKAINHYFWQTDKGYYGQFLYGRNYRLLSPRSETLGEALCMLFGIASPAQQRKMVQSLPISPYGVTCIYPQIPGIPPYHNNAVWPFVESFWTWASARAGDERAVLAGIADIYRPAALFLTNKENFVAENGDFAGTQINSSNMLWSLSGNLSVVHKVLFGIDLEDDSLFFRPCVPRAMAGERTLTGFPYRQSILDISLSGYGNQVRSFSVDGQETSTAAIPAGLTGRHKIRIVLAGRFAEDIHMNEVENYTSLPAPDIACKNDTISWRPVAGAVQYQIWKNGSLYKVQADTLFAAPAGSYAEYSVIAADKKGTGSFSSEPVSVFDAALVSVYQAENFARPSAAPYQGYEGKGYIKITRKENTRLGLSVDIPADGIYLFDFRYANGSGPVNTDNKCAIRSLREGGRELGVFVFPQRGKDEWSNWGYSNAIQLPMKKGKHLLSLDYSAFNENMNLEVNDAALDLLRVIRLR